ncbi:MAG: DUF3501 family protein [Alphaproteobacteria bacterium]|nr:DUF3501 family protein [Alphaproteobacteria bacterium]
MRLISKDDILPIEDYIKIRKERKRNLVDIKRHRRIEIGPVATAYFECFETMLHQVQEMLYIERGGEEQLADELAAYNPMIPSGKELVATVMFEINDPIRRQNFLSKLGGIEETMFIQVENEKIMGQPEEDVDRTTADGKASAVQFLHFPFTDHQIEAFKNTANQAIIGFDHPAYAHMAVLPKAVQEALGKDFD